MTPFWPWALERWSRPGVADGLLALQDRRGLSAPLLLWALWLDAHSLDGDVERAVALTRRWSEVTDGLRAARRALKSQAPPVADAGREALRRRVKAIELEAERLLMGALESLAGSPSAVGGDTLRRTLTALGCATSGADPGRR